MSVRSECTLKPLFPDFIWSDGNASDSEKDCLTRKLSGKCIHYLIIIYQAPLEVFQQPLRKHAYSNI